MRYRELIETIVYHGDDYDTTSLNPALMNNGNNQEGIGIYFTDNQETSHTYGKNIVAADIDISNFVPSRDAARDHISTEQLNNMLQELWQYDKEAMFYWASDWIYVTEPHEVKEYHLEELAEHIIDDEVRNLQIELAEHFGVEHMVRAWNKFTDIDGTYNMNRDDEMWIAIINPNIRIQKVTQ